MYPTIQITYLGLWDKKYPLYEAVSGELRAKGCSKIQAFRNLMGLISTQ